MNNQWENTIEIIVRDEGCILDTKSSWFAWTLTPIFSAKFNFIFKILVEHERIHLDVS